MRPVAYGKGAWPDGCQGIPPVAYRARRHVQRHRNERGPLERKAKRIGIQPYQYAILDEAFEFSDERMEAFRRFYLDSPYPERG